MKLKGIIATLSVICFLSQGCITFNSEYAKKDQDGHYLKHYNSCGPVAIEAAINEYYRKQGIVFIKNPAPQKEVSKKIQANGNGIRDFMSLIHYEGVLLTLPSEMKKVIEDYGYEVKSAENIEDLDPEKDIAVVLVWGCAFKREAHWICFPLYDAEEISKYYGKNTQISEILILGPKKVKKNLI